MYIRIKDFEENIFGGRFISYANTRELAEIIRNYQDNDESSYVKIEKNDYIVYFDNGTDNFIYVPFSTLPNDKLRRLCIEQNWFNDASNSQYNRLFEANENDENTLDDIVSMIFICTDNTDKYTIKKVLDNRIREYINNIYSDKEL